MGKLIHVLIPVYNTPTQYLEEAIGSILKQDAIGDEYHVQIIVVDDGSTNQDTLEMLEKYASNSSILLLKNKENQGVSATLNRGIEHSLNLNSDFIFRMDADDIAVSNRLKRQIEFLETHSNVDVLSGSVKLFYDNGRQKIFEAPVDVGQVHFEMFFYCSIVHPAVCFRSKLFERYPNIRYPTDYTRAEDYALWLHCITSTDILFDNIPMPYILLHRKHIQSESSIHSDTQKKSSLRALNNVLNNHILKTDVVPENRVQMNPSEHITDNMLRKILKFDSSLSKEDCWHLFELVETIESYLLSQTHFAPKDLESIKCLATQRLGEYALTELKLSTDYSETPSWKRWLLRNPKAEFGKLFQHSQSTLTIQFENETLVGITVICFSKDRAFQLKEYLRTLILFSKGSKYPIDVHVLWTASDTFIASYKRLEQMFPQVTFHKETDFSAQLIQLVENAREYLLWGVDDVLYYKPIPLDAIIQELEADSSILSCIIKLSPNISYCHPSNAQSLPPKEFVHLQTETLLKFDRTQCTQDWNYPFDLCASVMAKGDVLSLLDNIQSQFGKDALSHPNKLESAGDKIFREFRHPKSDLKYCLCMKEPILSVLTVNIVQDICNNPIYNEIDLHKMDQYFHDGYEMDLEYYQSNTFDSVHIGDFEVIKP